MTPIRRLSPYPLLIVALAAVLLLPSVISGHDEDPDPVVSHEGLPVGLWDPMVASDGTHVYTFGGSAEGTVTRAIYRIDPDSLTATKVGNLPAARTAGSVAYLDGLFYVFGGASSASSFSSDIIEFDPGTGDSRILPLAKLPNGLINTAAASDGQRVYVFGGYRIEAGRSDRIIQFNPQSTMNPVTTLNNRLPFAVDSASAAYDGDRIVVVGGQVAGQSTPKDTVLHFDPVSKNMENAAFTLPQGVRNAAITGNDGLVHVFSGATTGSRAQGTPAIIQINGTGAYTMNATLEPGRWQGGAGLVGDHAIVAAGRNNAEDYLRTLTRIDLTQLEAAPSTPEEEDPPAKGEPDNETESTPDENSTSENETVGEETGDPSGESTDPSDEDASGSDSSTHDIDDDSKTDASAETVPGPGIALVLVIAIWTLERHRRNQRRL